MDAERKREILAAETRANLLVRLVQRGWYVVRPRQSGRRTKPAPDRIVGHDEGDRDV